MALPTISTGGTFTTTVVGPYARGTTPNYEAMATSQVAGFHAARSRSQQVVQGLHALFGRAVHDAVQVDFDAMHEQAGEALDSLQMAIEELKGRLARHAERDAAVRDVIGQIIADTHRRMAKAPKMAAPKWLEEAVTLAVNIGPPKINGGPVG